MDNNLAMHIPITPLQTTRGFTGDAILGDTTVGDYWIWAHSDIIGNTNRGMLAQFIVSRALGDTRPANETWAPYDVIAHDGTKVEVKSAAYVQSWSQKRYSRITFSIAKTLEWNPTTEEWVGPNQVRQSDAYVFALVTEKDKTKVDTLDLRQWEFYVVPTWLLNRELGDAKSVSLTPLRQLASPVSVGGLRTSLALAVGGSIA